MSPEDMAVGLGTLGDFRLIREVGRGGMGVVYEAEQLSLRRRVALKVLPFAAATDPRLLQRFKVEAQAAARLQHAHIVPAYAVGSERGIPYYAMQLIDGRSLADVIRELRQLAGPDRPGHPRATGALATTAPAASACAGATPGADGPTADFSLGAASGDPCEDVPAGPVAGAPGGRPHHARSHIRAAVTLILQAAEAIEHAHENGVIHRDIKPANLMIDGRDHLWVADFGLARLRAADNLTTTGDLLGTLRYMSPEQARGRGAVVDHRTDIYSLGATLYELLTLTPAVCGRNQQEILRQIDGSEPRPPSRLNPAISADLETVILTAMAKEPDRRYATAGALAEDLRCLLQDRPIRARRPSPLERLERFGRRHGPAISAAAGALLLATIGMGIGLAAVARGRDEARRQAALAEAEFLLVLDVVDKLLTRLSEERLLDEPGLQPLRRDLHRTATSYLQALAAARGEDARIRAPLARALVHVAALSQQLGEGDEALATCRRAVRMYQELVNAQPRAVEHQAGLARAELTLARLLRGRGQLKDAKAWAEGAAATCDRLVAAEPRVASHRALLAEGLIGLSNLARDLGNFAAARSCAERAIRIFEASPDMPDFQVDLADAYINLGVLQAQEGDRAGADRSLAEAVARLERPDEAEPRPGARRDGRRYLLAWAYLHLGKLRRDAGELVPNSIEIWRELSRAHPRVVSYRDGLARGYLGLAEVRRELGQAEPARRAYEESIRVQQGLVRDAPDQSSYWVRLGETYSGLGDLLFPGDRPAAHDRYREAIAAFDRGHSRLPGDPEINNALATFLIECPDNQLRNPERALKLAREAAETAAGAGLFVRTQGMAAYFTHRDGEAVEALERAFALHPVPDVDAGLVLSLAYARLRHDDRAAFWRAKVDGWIGEGHPRGERLKSLLEEPHAGELATPPGSYCHAQSGNGARPAPGKAALGHGLEEGGTGLGDGPTLPADPYRRTGAKSVGARPTRPGTRPGPQSSGGADAPDAPQPISGAITFAG